MRSTKLDKFPVSDECVACVCLNAIPPPVVFASDAPMGIPDLGDWVLHDDPIAELEFWAQLVSNSRSVSVLQESFVQPSSASLHGSHVQAVGLIEIT